MFPCDHTSVGALVWKEGRLLLIDRKRPPFGLAPPAGHVDEHGEKGATEEARYETATRAELTEETGLVATSLKLLCEGRKDTPCRRGGEWHYWRVYEADVSGELVPNPEETKGYRWVKSEELPALIENGTIEPVWREWFRTLGYR